MSRGKYPYPNQKHLLTTSRFDVIEIGETYKRQIVDHPGAVVILPIANNGDILLIRNLREGVVQTLLELPAGTLEPGEEPMPCAARELQEETGYNAASIEPFLNIYSTPGFCNERLFVFVAKDLTFVGQDLDPTENIEVESFSLSTILEMVVKGEIVDAKTLATLFIYIQKNPS